jgi:hypothetical protein
VIGTPASGRPSRVHVKRALAAAVSHRRLVLALYLPSALLALVTAAPVFLAAHTLSLLGPWVPRAAEGGQLRFLLEVGASNAASSMLEEPPLPELTGAARGVLVGALGALFGVFLQGLAYNVVAGGVLERLAKSPDGSFWNACRHWVWPMLRFGILALLGLLALGGAGMALIAVLPGSAPSSLLAKVGGAVLWLALVNGTLELGRADMVVRRDRRAARALVRAIALPARPALFLQAVTLWAALAAVGAAYWGFTGAALATIPTTAVFAAFAAHQVVAALGAWLKLARLALAIEVASVMAETTPTAVFART